MLESHAGRYCKRSLNILMSIWHFTVLIVLRMCNWCHAATKETAREGALRLMTWSSNSDDLGTRRLE